MDRKSLIKHAALSAGSFFKSASPTEGIVAKEGRGNFVTAADLVSEKIVVDLIHQYYLGDQILSEETYSKTEDVLGAEHLWVIDPIDGTNNFRFGRNFSCVSIGYVEKGIIKLGAVYNPYVDEFFFAEKGKGAFVNDKRLAIGNETDLHSSVLGTDNSYFPKVGRRHLQMLLAVQPTPFIMMKGSAALALCEIAAGRTDLYFHTNIHPWDNAAGFLLVQESGGVIKDFQGNHALFTSNEIIAGNKTLVDQFLQVVSHI